MDGSMGGCFIMYRHGMINAGSYMAYRADGKVYGKGTRGQLEE